MGISELPDHWNLATDTVVIYGASKVNASSQQGRQQKVLSAQLLSAASTAKPAANKSLHPPLNKNSNYSQASVIRKTTFLVAW
jgi:hypothetical protein